MTHWANKNDAYVYIMIDGVSRCRLSSRWWSLGLYIWEDQCHKHERPSVLSEQPNENIGGTTKYIPDLCTAMRQIVSREIVRNVMNLIMLMKLDFLKGHPFFRSSRSA